MSDAVSAAAMVSMRPRKPLRAKPKGKRVGASAELLSIMIAFLHMIIIATLIWIFA